MSLEQAKNEWLAANDKAVDAAAKCMTKKGYFNPPLEKPWPEWAKLRLIADEKWYAFYAETSRLPAIEERSTNKHNGFREVKPSCTLVHRTFKDGI